MSMDQRQMEALILHLKIKVEELESKVRDLLRQVATGKVKH